MCIKIYYCKHVLSPKGKPIFESCCAKLIHSDIRSNPYFAEESKQGFISFLFSPHIHILVLILKVLKFTHSEIGILFASTPIVCRGFLLFCGVVIGTISSLATILLMRGSRKFCQRESNSDVILFVFCFLIMRERSKHH